MTIRQRLIVAFGLNAVLVLAMAVFSLVQLSALEDLTTSMHEHPFAVSGAAREIQHSISEMQGAMRDMLLATGPAELEAAVSRIAEHERTVMAQFQVASDRILGDRSATEAARREFVAWRPLREEVIALARSGDRKGAIEALRTRGAGQVARVEETAAAELEFANRAADGFARSARSTARRTFAYVAVLDLAVIAVGVILAAFLTRRITRSLDRLAEGARQLASGKLEHRVESQSSDEVGRLAEAFNQMAGSLQRSMAQETAGRASLEKLLEAVGGTASSLASGTAEILAATSQQASGAQEQAAAVAETVTTVDEITQTADQAAQRAKDVADASGRSAETGRAGRRAVEDSVAGMGTVKEQVESIAESILALAEQAQAIGEIIASVNDIAEQTNLLALNAGIEASRAGEHGRGFQVVAAEVKALADQAKKATAQVRQILGDIQKATNGAVMATEEGQKSVNATLKLVGQAGDTIKSLADTIAEAAQSAAQIAASAGQQAIGITQIHQAMKNISTVTNQNLASTRRQEKAAQELNALGEKLTEQLRARRA